MNDLLENSVSRLGHVTVKSKILEAYVDESELLIGGKRILLYGAAIPHDLGAALEGLAQLKADYDLPPNLEVKWSSKGGDPLVKAALKGQAISLVGQLFSCVFVIWASTDKDEAFLRMAELLRQQAAQSQKRFVHLLYDEGAFKTKKEILWVLCAWNEPTCSLLASVDSRLSPPMQFADLAIGAFRYLLRASLGEIRPRTTVFEWEPGHTEELTLDQVFAILLRHTIPGATPYLDDSAPSPPEDYMRFLKQCLGVGVVVDDRFSPEEIATISRAATFFIGCMS